MYSVPYPPPSGDVQLMGAALLPRAMMNKLAVDEGSDEAPELQVQSRLRQQQRLNQTLRKGGSLHRRLSGAS